MKLSVAMCTYNGEVYVREQLASIAAQTRLPDEVVICDDNSTDETGSIVRAFASRSPFPVHMHVNGSRLGVENNFEQAIRLCSGDLIALSDQDDVWRPEKLERSSMVLAANPAVGLVFSDAEVVDEHLHPLGYRLWDSIGFVGERKRIALGPRAFDLLLRCYVATGATMVFRSKFRELVLPIPVGTRWPHDGWIATLLAAIGDVVVIDEPLMRYRQHPHQQIGAAQPDKGQVGSRAVRRLLPVTDLRGHFAGIGDLQVLHDRLCASGADQPRVQRAAAEVKRNITHLRARGSMPSRKLRRVPVVLRELASFRYHRYSHGALSAGKDLFLS